MEPLIVWHTVPVAVVVDTDNKTVTRVVVDVEGIERVDGPVEWEQGGHTTAPDTDARDLAVMIAESDASDWPAWEIGW